MYGRAKTDAQRHSLEAFRLPKKFLEEFGPALDDRGILRLRSACCADDNFPQDAK